MKDRPDQNIYILIKTTTAYWLMWAVNMCTYVYNCWLCILIQPRRSFDICVCGYADFCLRLRRADGGSTAAGSQAHESGSREQRLIPGCLAFSSSPPTQPKLILGLDWISVKQTEPPHTSSLHHNDLQIISAH